MIFEAGNKTTSITLEPDDMQKIHEIQDQISEQINAGHTVILQFVNKDVVGRDDTIITLQLVLANLETVAKANVQRKEDQKGTTAYLVSM